MLCTSCQSGRFVAEISKLTSRLRLLPIAEVSFEVASAVAGAIERVLVRTVATVVVEIAPLLGGDASSTSASDDDGDDGNNNLVVDMMVISSYLIFFKTASRLRHCFLVNRAYVKRTPQLLIYKKFLFLRAVNHSYPLSFHILQR